MNMLLKSKVGLGAITLAIIASAMAITNPNREEYVNYASAHLIDEVKNSLCQSPEVQTDSDTLREIAQDVALGISGFCKGAVTAGGIVGLNPVKNIIDSRTTRQNWLIVSIYTTNVPGKTFKTVGVFDNFFTHEMSQQ